jgi:hypothetical protein
MLPTEPAKKAIGRNTETRVTLMPISAAVIWPIAFLVASRGGSPPRS